MAYRLLQKTPLILTLLFLLNCSLGAMSSSSSELKMLVSSDELMATLNTYGVNLEGEWSRHITSNIDDALYLFEQSPIDSKYITHIMSRIAEAHANHQNAIETVAPINPANNTQGMEIEKLLKFTLPQNLSLEEKTKRSTNSSITLANREMDQLRVETIPLSQDGTIHPSIMLHSVYQSIYKFFKQHLFSIVIDNNPRKVYLERGKKIPQFYIVYKYNQNYLWLECRGYEDVVQNRNYEELSWYKPLLRPQISKLANEQSIYQQPPQSWKRWAFNTGRWIVLFSALGYLAYEALNDNNQQEQLLQQITSLSNDLTSIRQNITTGASDYCINQEANSITSQLYELQIQLNNTISNLPSSVTEQLNSIHEYFGNSGNALEVLAEQITTLNGSTEGIRKVLFDFFTLQQQTRCHSLPSCFGDNNDGENTNTNNHDDGNISPQTLAQLLEDLKRQ